MGEISMSGSRRAANSIGGYSTPPRHARFAKLPLDIRTRKRLYSFLVVAALL